TEMRKLSASRGNSIDPASRAGPATPEKSRLPDRLNRNPSRQHITNLASVRKGTIVREKYDPLYAKLSPISNRKPRRGRKAWIRKRGFPSLHSRLPQSAQKRFELLHRLPAVVCFLSSLTAWAKGRGEDKVELKRTLSGSLCLLRQLSGCPFRCANLCFLS